MKILFIMNGMSSYGGLPGISGGAIRWIECAKIWQNNGHEIHVYTPRSGKDFCIKFGLNAIFHIFDVPDKFSIKTYFIRAFKSYLLPNSLKKFDGIIYSSCEHWYDVVPAIKILKYNKSSKWIVVAHWVAPLRRKGTDFFQGLLFYINQRTGYYYIKKYADAVLAVSDTTADQVTKIGVPKNIIYSVSCGVDYQNIQKIVHTVQHKEYDAIFMKRFDGTKGVFDIIEIWNKVTKSKSDAKLGMIGLGTKEVMIKLHKMIKNFHLEENIEFLGPIYDIEKKFSILAKSKLFVLPSYEENWAIVIGEAMAVGLPVLCYDIKEIKPIWQDKIIWIPMGNKKQFANEINRLLSDENLRENLSREGLDFIKKYDWKKIAENELDILING